MRWAEGHRCLICLLATLLAALLQTRQALADFTRLTGSVGSEVAARPAEAGAPTCYGAAPMDEGAGACDAIGAAPEEPEPAPQDGEFDFGALSTRIAMLGVAASRREQAPGAGGLGGHQPFKVLRQRVLAALPDLQALYFEARAASGAGAGVGPGSCDAALPSSHRGSQNGSVGGSSRRESSGSRGRPSLSEQGRLSGAFGEPSPGYAAGGAAGTAQQSHIGAAGILSMLSTTSQLVQHSRLRILSEISKDDLYLSDSIVSRRVGRERCGMRCGIVAPPIVMKEVFHRHQ